MPTLTSAPPGAVFDNAAFRRHEQVVFNHDPETGLRSIIAIHSTVLGPALGGARFFPYRSDTDALVDCLRLSEGMTWKAALAGLDLGGGKAVIIGDPGRDRTDALICAFGRFVDRLGGRYITAEDVGTNEADMDLIATTTAHVTGRSTGGGDPSPSTALGVFESMRAVARHWWGGTGDLAGRRVVVSGVGKVGGALARQLAAVGAVVTVADVHRPAAEQVAAETGAALVVPAGAHQIPCDIYAPCALGAVLNPATIPELRCQAVVGAANNQLADESSATQLAAAGILYVPDFVANAGGRIHVSSERHFFDAAVVEARVRRIGDTVAELLSAAEIAGLNTSQAAVALAQQRLGEDR